MHCPGSFGRQDLRRHSALWESALLLNFLLFVTSCSLFLGSRRVVGTIDPSAVGTILVPRSVTTGQTFVVSVGTNGGGCVSPEGAEVRVSGLLAEIIPYDRVRTDLPCDLALHWYPRDVLLRFDSPGLATIQIIGQGEQGKEEIFERQVEVK